jgi:hypothetical protein
MSDKLNQLFKKTKELEPSSELRGSIMAVITLEKNRKLRWKIALSKAGIGFSVLAFLGALFAFGDLLFNSEFASMLTLAFSDLAAVIQNWNDYALLLIETFPALTVAVIILPVFLLMASSSYYLNLINKNNHKYI